MWFLLILAVANAALDQSGFVLEHRLTIAGMPINFLDGLLIAGTLVMLVRMLLPANRMQAPVHPALGVSLILFALAFLGGMLGNAMNGAGPYRSMQEFRNFLSFPLCVALGYTLLQTPRSSGLFAHVHVIAGVAGAALTLLFFFGKSAEGGAEFEITNVRIVQFISSYAGMGAAFLLYTIAAGRPVLPLPVALVVAGFSFVGCCATLSRSDWLAAFGGLLSVALLLPRGQRAGKVVAVVLLIPLMIAALWVGVYFASSISGRDVGDRMYTRVLSLIPGVDAGEKFKAKAWDTRLPGIKQELKLWTNNPLIGNGFGYTRTARREADHMSVAFDHNVFTSALATTGILGFAAYTFPFIAMMVIGRRMVRQYADKGSMLIGAAGFTTGVFCLILGACTMCHNTERGAICAGLVVGVVFRARAMQLALLRQHAGSYDPAALQGWNLQPLIADAQPQPAHEDAADYYDAYGLQA